MVALQFTYSFPNIKNTRNTAFGLTATTGVTVQITNYDNVRDLNGPFQNVGINSPVIGVDAVHDNSMEFVGISAGVVQQQEEIFTSIKQTQELLEGNLCLL